MVKNHKLNTKYEGTGNHLCSRYQEYSSYGIRPVSAKKDEFFRSGVLRAVITEYKRNPAMTRDDAMAFIKEKFDAKEFVSESSKNFQMEEVKTLFQKYMDADDRRSIPVRTYKRDVQVENEDGTMETVEVSACPDFMYETEIQAEYINESGEAEKAALPFITVGNFTTGRQSHTTNARGNKFENSIFYCLESYGLFICGVEHLKGKRGILTIVFDALKTNSDRYGDYSRPWSQAPSETGGTQTDNRLFYSVMVDENGHPVPKQMWHTAEHDALAEKGSYDVTKLEGNFAESMKVWLKGKGDCRNSSVCENCAFNNVCNHAENPQKKEKAGEKETTFTPTELTPQQTKIAGVKKGILVVPASAGSGKSTTIVARLANLILDGTKPEDIILLSFSVAAITVLVERVGQVLSKQYGITADVSKIKICTFNSMGYEIIKKYYKELGFEQPPELVDETENYFRFVLKSIDFNHLIPSLDYKNIHMSLGNIKGAGRVFEEIYSTIRRENMDKDAFLEYYKDAYPEPEDLEEIWKSYERYVELLRTNNYIDFADQSNLVERLINEDDDLIVNMYEAEHIIVDEFQDSDLFQLLLLQCLVTNPKWKSLMVVGDPAQAIYDEMRHTSPEYLVNLKDFFWWLNTKTISLSVNHRSVQSIVDAGNAVINNYAPFGSPKEDTSSREEEGEKPVVETYASRSKEISGVVEKVKALIESGVSPNEVCVIARNRSFLKAVKKGLAEVNVPTQYDMKEEYLKNSRVIAAIGLAEFMSSSSEFLSRGLLEYLTEFYLPVSILNEDTTKILERNRNTVMSLMETMRDEEKMLYFFNLLQALDDGEDAVYKSFVDKLKAKTKYSFSEIITYIMEFKTYDSKEGALKDGEYDAVSLVTAHSSKGKEWTYVIGSLSDFDSPNTAISKATWRLVYVLITRAKDHLYLSVTAGRGKDGDSFVNRILRGIRELPEFEVVSVS